LNFRLQAGGFKIIRQRPELAQNFRFNVSYWIGLAKRDGDEKTFL
jgi:hypothetical protein